MQRRPSGLALAAILGAGNVAGCVGFDRRGEGRRSGRGENQEHGERPRGQGGGEQGRGGESGGDAGVEVGAACGDLFAALKVEMDLALADELLRGTPALTRALLWIAPVPVSCPNSPRRIHT